MYAFFVKFDRDQLQAAYYFTEQSPAEEKKQKEEKKRYLLRKLSFRPTVEELKEKKVIKRDKKDFFEISANFCCIECLFFNVSKYSERLGYKNIVEFKFIRYIIVSYFTKVLFFFLLWLNGLRDTTKRRVAIHSSSSRRLSGSTIISK